MKKDYYVTFAALCSIFPNYIWEERCSEIFGLSKDGTKIVKIDDGMCVNRREEGEDEGWCAHQYKLLKPHPNESPVEVWNNHHEDIDTSFENKLLEEMVKPYYVDGYIPDYKCYG